MAVAKAKPGDRIRATSGGISGNEYVVIECPTEYPEALKLKDVVWVMSKFTSTPATIRHKNYEIISRADEPQKKVMVDTASCKDCDGTGKIQLFTSVVDCDCIKTTPSSLSGCPQTFDPGSYIMNGWFSASLKLKHGSVFYKLAKTGKEVELTTVSLKITPPDNSPDLKFIGVVDMTKGTRGSIH